MSKDRWLDITGLAILSILPLFWFQQDYINWGDFMFPMAPTGNVLTNYYHIWTDKWGLGLVNSRALPQLPFMALLTLATQFGISTAISERILFYLIFLLSGISIYFLVYILPFNAHKRAIAVFASLFYMFNPFNIVLYWHILDGMIFTYAVLPALLVLYLQWFKTRNILYAILFFIVTFFGGYTFSNPLIIPLLWATLLFFNFLVLEKKTKVKAVLKFYLIALSIWSLVNTWWLLPLFASFADEYSGLSINIGTPWDTLSVFSAKASFLNLFRFSDLFWAFGENIHGDPFYNYATVYNSVLFIAVSFLIPMIVFFPIVNSIFNKKLPGFILLLYGFTLCFMFLAKGNHPPLGEELYRVFFSLPFLSAFRAPIHKFGILISISYALLFGYGLTTFYLFLKKKGDVLAFSSVSIIGCMVFIIYSYPLWTGEVIHDGGGTYPSSHVSVPEYYLNASEWLNRDSEYFRFYSFPQSPTMSVMYDWDNGYAGGDPSFNLFSKPGVYSTVDELAQLPYTLLRDENENNIYKILRLQGVKYIILHKDAHDQLWDIFSGKYRPTSYLETSLNNQKEISKSKEFGKLKFYKLNDNAFLPPIYASTETLVFNSDRNLLEKLIPSDFLDGQPAIVFTDIQDAGTLQDILNNQKNSVNNQFSSYSRIFFANRTFNDLAINLIVSENFFNSESISAGNQKSILVQLDDKGKMDLLIDNKGIYDVYINSMKLSNTWVGLKIRVDKDELEYWSFKDAKDAQWTMIGKVDLTKGNHSIEVLCLEYSCELKRMAQSIEIVLIAENKIQKLDDLWKSKKIGYLFYKEKETIKSMLEYKDKTEQVVLKGINPFEIGTKNFYTPKDGTYSIRALIKPKRIFQKREVVVDSYNSNTSVSSDTLHNWDIKGANTFYKQSFSEDGMYIDAFFRGRGDAEENIILTKEFPDINIKENPYLGFFCEMEDMNVQEVKINIEFTDLSGKLLSFRTKKMLLTPNNNEFVINLYEKAKDFFGKDTAEHLFANKVILNLRKRAGADFSQKMQAYRFTFKKLFFLKTQPFLASFVERLSANLPGNYYYFDKKGLLRNAVFFEQVPPEIENVYKLNKQGFIDLTKSPLLSFSINKPDSYYFNWGENSFPQTWEIIWGIDTDGDEKEDEAFETTIPVIAENNNKLLLTFAVLKEAEKRFPGKMQYNLVSIGIKHPVEKETFYQDVITKELIRYKDIIYKYSDFDVGSKVLELDSATYNLPSSIIENDNMDSYNWVEYSNVVLKKGEHSLKVLQNSKYRVAMVEIKPEDGRHESEVGIKSPPIIEFRKIGPTRYVVDVNDAKNPFPLVFSENYHKGWKAYIVPSEFGRTGSDRNTGIELWSGLWNVWKDKGKRVEIKDHFVVNGYANGWIVPDMQGAAISGQEADEGEDFQIIIDFLPQRFFEAGLLVSAIALLGCIGFLGLGLIRQRKKRPNEN